MPPSNDPTASRLLRQCTLAEKTIVLLRKIDRARDSFRAFHFDPDAFADELAALLAEAKVIHSDRLDANRALLIAQEEGRDAAQAAYAQQAVFRERLRAAGVLTDDPLVKRDLVDARRRLDLRSPRLTGALDKYRRLATCLATPDHGIYAHPVTATLHDEVEALVAQLDDALQARDAAQRACSQTAERVREIRDALMASLRRVRRMGHVVSRRPDTPASLFSHLKTRKKASPPPETVQTGPECQDEPETSRLAGGGSRLLDAASRLASAANRLADAETRLALAGARLANEMGKLSPSNEDTSTVDA